MGTVVRPGRTNIRERRKAEGRLIFKSRTLQQRGIDVDFGLCQRTLHMLPLLNKMTRADSNGYFTDEVACSRLSRFVGEERKRGASERMKGQ